MVFLITTQNIPAYIGQIVVTAASIWWDVTGAYPRIHLRLRNFASRGKIPNTPFSIFINFNIALDPKMQKGRCTRMAKQKSDVLIWPQAHKLLCTRTHRNSVSLILSQTFYATLLAVIVNAVWEHWSCRVPILYLPGHYLLAQMCNIHSNTTKLLWLSD